MSIATKTISAIISVPLYALSELWTFKLEMTITTELHDYCDKD